NFSISTAPAQARFSRALLAQRPATVTSHPSMRSPIQPTRGGSLLKYSGTTYYMIRFDQVKIDLPNGDNEPMISKTYVLEATGNDTLRFKSANLGTAGWMLDNITLTEVSISTPLSPPPQPPVANADSLIR